MRSWPNSIIMVHYELYYWIIIYIYIIITFYIITARIFPPSLPKAVVINFSCKVVSFQNSSQNLHPSCMIYLNFGVVLEWNTSLPSYYEINTQYLRMYRAVVSDACSLRYGLFFELPHWDRTSKSLMQSSIHIIKTSFYLESKRAKYYANFTDLNETGQLK